MIRFRRKLGAMICLVLLPALAGCGEVVSFETIERALMDDQSTADALLQDQESMEAPLSSDLMAIGTPDTMMLPEETVGWC